MHDDRLGGNTLPSADGVVPSYLDARQWILAGAAARRWLANRLGGAGLLAGGAASLSDLPSGTGYPACELLIDDDDGEAWPKQTTSTTAIEGLATSGSVKLYAVLPLLDDVTPDAIDAALEAVRFVSQASAAAAPTHSLLLGTGTVTAGAFTAYSPSLTARRATVALPAAAALADGAIGSLTIGTTYSQAEVQALRDQSELLLEMVLDLRTKAQAAIAALHGYQLLKPS